MNSQQKYYENDLEVSYKVVEPDRNKTKKTGYMNKLFCFLIGHKFILKRYICHDIEEIKCERCKKEYALNHSLKVILPLDTELKRANSMILSNHD